MINTSKVVHVPIYCTYERQRLNVQMFLPRIFDCHKEVTKVQSLGFRNLIPDIKVA